MENLIKRILAKWVLRNYPFNVTTKVLIIKTIYVKKGKIREWRSYDENHNRIELIN
tara:strand:+ start:1776 stop:1943 length:168 start_codon:yes stop_codon:yes gene_type:complete